MHFHRSIYEDEIAPAGERWFKIVTSTRKVGTVHLPMELVDGELIASLSRLLERMDPEPRHLQVVPPSSRPRKSRGKSAPPTLTIC